MSGLCSVALLAYVENCHTMVFVQLLVVGFWFRSVATDDVVVRFLVAFVCPVATDDAVGILCSSSHRWSRFLNRKGDTFIS